jgi:hypothetical protein
MYILVAALGALGLVAGLGSVASVPSVRSALGARYARSVGRLAALGSVASVRSFVWFDCRRGCCQVGVVVELGLLSSWAKSALFGLIDAESSL